MIEPSHTLDLSRLRKLDAVRSAAVGKGQKLLQDYQALFDKQELAQKKLKDLKLRLDHRNRTGDETYAPDPETGKPTTVKILKQFILEEEAKIAGLSEDIDVKMSEMQLASEEATAAEELFRRCNRFVQDMIDGE